MEDRNWHAMYPKFVITGNGEFRFGTVRHHKDLLLHGEHCLGGGYYEFDVVAMRLLLSGESSDFGAPRWNRIDTLIVPETLFGLRIFYSRGGHLADGDGALDEFLKIEYR